MKIFFKFLIILSSCFHFGYSQELSKKHKVKKGETVYQISRLYNVDPNEILRLNPNSGDTIEADDVLILPSTSSNNNFNASGNTTNLTHTVQAGETKFGLAKQFGISIQELETQNPEIKNGLLTGQVLNINNTKNSTSQKITKQEIKVVSDSGKTYMVKDGDTKFSLSKKFNVSIQDLESLNPQIVKVLPASTLIKIPQSNGKLNTPVIPENELNTPEIAETQKETKVQEKPQTILSNDAYASRVIKSNETLYSLSKEAGMTIPDFLKLNPQLSESVKIGTVIKMPVNAVGQNVNSSFSKNSFNDTSEGKYRDLRNSVNKTTTKKVLIALPFSEEELTSYKTNPARLSSNDLKKSMEFYLGMKTAIDSIKSLGLNLDTTTLSINSEKIDANAKDLPSQYDVILAPFFDESIKSIPVESYLNKDTPLVATYFPLGYNAKTLVFEALPSLRTQQKMMLDYLNKKNGNIIVLSDKDRQENRNFIKSYTPNAIIIELKKNNDFREDDLVSSLVKSKMNYVIIDSDKTGVFLSSTNVLLKQLSTYKIQLAVLEASLIPNEEQISSKRFRILKLAYPKINQISNNPQTLRYLKSYKNKYQKDASENVLFGFDITFDTLLRIYQPVSFEQSVKNDKTSYLSLKFNYEKEQNTKYINNEIAIFEYNDD